MPRFLKICGARTPTEAKMISKYADATGVVVGCKSKRRVGIETAKRIIESCSMPVFIVSTSTDIDEWSAMIDNCAARHVQVHSDDAEPGLVRKIKDMHGVEVMKAFKVPMSSDDPQKDAGRLLERISEYEADKVMLDTGCGSGLMHDLRVSRLVSKNMEIVVAGGLNGSNVSNVIRIVRPFGIDVSSGVENNGNKCESSIKEFCSKFRVTRDSYEV